MQQQDNHEYPFLYQRQTCHQVQPNQATYQKRQKCQPATYLQRSEERFSRNAETDLVCRLLLEKKNNLNPDRRSLAAAGLDAPLTVPHAVRSFVHCVSVGLNSDLYHIEE